MKVYPEFSNPFYEARRYFIHEKVGLITDEIDVLIGAISRYIFSFFANQNFCRDRKAELLCNLIALASTLSEIQFHWLPSKCKRPSIRKQIALRNSHLQRDI